MVSQRMEGPKWCTTLIQVTPFKSINNECGCTKQHTENCHTYLVSKLGYMVSEIEGGSPASDNKDLLPCEGFGHPVVVAVQGGTFEVLRTSDVCDERFVV